MKYLFYLFFLVLLACSPKHEGYDEMDSGLFFKLMSISDSTKRIQENDFIQLKYAFSNFAQQELAGSRLLIKVNDTEKKGGLVEALTLINEKEIGAFIFPLKNLKSDLSGIIDIEGIPDSTLLHAELQIDNIYRKEEFELEQKKFVQWVNQVDTRDFDVLKEELLLDRIEDSLNVKSKKTPTGLRYIVRKKGMGEEASFGKRVELAYEGKFLNGEVFNSSKSLKNGVQDFYVGQELQVIKGIEEALLYMQEGDEVLLLLPSWIAFGKDGSSTKIVPPKTPVLYELRLQKVN